MDTSGIVANLEGNVIAYSKGAEKIFGYKKEEVLGKNVAIFHPKRTHDMLPRLFKTVLEKGVFEEKITLIRKNGEEFPALLRVQVIRDEKGQVTGLAGMTKDLTEKK